MKFLLIIQFYEEIEPYALNFSVVGSFHYYVDLSSLLLKYYLVFLKFRRFLFSWNLRTFDRYKYTHWHNANSTYPFKLIYR